MSDIPYHEFLLSCFSLKEADVSESIRDRLIDGFYNDIFHNMKVSMFSFFLKIT
jgi:hypothetical protein